MSGGCVFVCCVCGCKLPPSPSSLSLRTTECCYDNPSWSLLHRRGPQYQHSGNLLAVGRQHKIGIIAVDYAPTMGRGFWKIHSSWKKETAEGRRWVGIERGALVPPLLSHGGHRRDISGLKETGILGDMPTPSSPSHTLAPHPVGATPPLSFLAPCQFGCSAWPGKLGPLPLFACETKPLWRKREEAWELHMVAAKSRDGRFGLPFTGPLFWLRGAGVTLGPLSPRVSLTLAPHSAVTPSSLAPLTLAPILTAIPSFPTRAFEWGWHVKGFRMSDFSWHNLCRQRWDSIGFCCGTRAFVWRGNSFPTHFPN